MTDMTGINAICEALKMNSVLEKCNLKFNNINTEAKAALQEAVKGREGFEMLMYS